MSEDVRKHVGELLRELRMARGLTLSQVQELTRQIDWPVSRSRLSLLERGEVDVHLADLYPLSRTYGFAIGALISEAVVAHSKKKFAKGLDAKELFEKAKELFRVGNPLEAAWAFDEAGRRAADGDPDFRYLCMISAAYCYERVRALDLAISRVEQVIDSADDRSESFVRAVAIGAALYAKTSGFGRARIMLRHLETIDLSRLGPEIRGFVWSTQAEVVSVLGDAASASSLARKAARVFRKLGDASKTGKSLAVAAKYLLRVDPPRKRDALRLVRDAEALLPDGIHVESQIFVHLYLAEALVATERFEEAYSSAESAYRLANKHHYVEQELSACEILEFIESARGRSDHSSAWTQRRLKLMANTEITTDPRRAARHRGRLI